jgi:hypothetical protein
VLDEEIFIAPPLERRIAVTSGRLSQCAVEVLRVVFEQVRRRQVGTATKPPSRWLASVATGIDQGQSWVVDPVHGTERASALLALGHALEVTVVEMNGGRIGIARVNDETETAGHKGQRRYAIVPALV